jgi:hypothetical protein
MTGIDGTLEREVASLVEAHPEGLGEFDLVRALRARGFSAFGRFGSRLALFQAHFILFHVLYKLRDEWLRTGRGWLEIGALRIQLHPTSAAPAEATESRLATEDRLRSYYLDLSNLKNTTEDDVSALLEQFWQRIDQGAGDPERRRDALSVLELSDPVSRDEIKRQYRRLSLRHHPDRGGDPDRFRAVHDAMQFLALDFG